MKDNRIGIFLIILLSVTATIFLIGLVAYNFLIKNPSNWNLMESFCEESGYNFSNARSTCWKIENDTFIERDIGIIEGQVYWIGEKK